MTGNLVSLSEQELVDCESNNSGCNGGLMENAFELINNSGGIMTETDYPYRAVNGTCDANKLNSPVVVIDGHENVPVNSEDDLMKAVANQPLPPLGLSSPLGAATALCLAISSCRC